MPKSTKKRGIVPSQQPQPDFSKTCEFREVLDNVDFGLMIFQRILMAGFRDIGENEGQARI